MGFDIGDLPLNIKELVVHAENADPNCSWDDFIAKCRDAGYRILEEDPDSNRVLIVQERFED